MEDTEKLSLAQIKDLADKESVKTEEVKPEVKAEPIVAAPVVEEEPEITIYRRTIDLGDGSGVQVFEGESQDELNDKLAEAQANATRKIRELSQELADRRAKDKPIVEISADQETVFSHELMKNPTKAVKDIFKALTGEDISEFRTVKQRTDAIEEVKQRDVAASRFISSHPDYQDNARNAQLINMHIKSEGQKYTSESFHQAYLALSKSGLLELKPKEENVGTEPPKAEAERIATPVITEVTTQRTRRSSGLSTQTRVAAPVVTNEPSEDELRTMPLDKLRDLANRQMASRA